MLTDDVKTSSVELNDTPLFDAPAPSEEAWRAVHARYFPGMVNAAVRQGAEDPQGVAGETLFDVIRRQPWLIEAETRRCRTYLHRSLRNRILNDARRRRLDVELVDEMPSATSIHDDDLDELDGFVELLAPLTDAERDVVAHRFLGGFSANETAVRVGRSPAAVRRLQHEAIRRLRGTLIVAALAVLAVLLFVAAQGSTSNMVEITPADDIDEREESFDDSDRSAVDAEFLDEDAEIEAGQRVGGRGAGVIDPASHLAGEQPGLSGEVGTSAAVSPGVAATGSLGVGADVADSAEGEVAEGGEAEDVGETGEGSERQAPSRVIASASSDDEPTGDDATEGEDANAQDIDDDEPEGDDDGEDE